MESGTKIRIAFCDQLAADAALSADLGNYFSKFGGELCTGSNASDFIACFLIGGFTYSEASPPATEKFDFRKKIRHRFNMNKFSTIFTLLTLVVTVNTSFAECNLQPITFHNQDAYQVTYADGITEVWMKFLNRELLVIQMEKLLIIQLLRHTEQCMIST